MLGHNNMDKRIIYLGDTSQPLPGNVVAAANEIIQLQGVKQLVLLPDFHFKDKCLEKDFKAAVPSSIAISSDANSFYPQFGALGVGCGMMMIRTGILLDELPVKLSSIIDALPKFFANRVGRRHLPENSDGRSFKMSSEDMVNMCIHGAPWIANKYGVPKENLNYFNNKGVYLTEDEISNFNWDKLANSWQQGIGRSLTQVGSDLGGNHFVELQVVEQVPSGNSPQDLKPGELVFLYHGSCTELSWILHESCKEHLVRQKDYKCFPKGSWEYETVFLAQNALLNWSAAARCLVIARLNCFLKKLLNRREIEGLRCVSEAPHNMMRREIIDRKEKIIYRHNAVPINKGVPSIVSGRYDCNTYLFFSGKTPENSLYSLDHGLGNLLEINNESAEKHLNIKTERVFKKFWRDFTFGNVKSRQQLLKSESYEKYFYRPYLSHGLVDKQCVITRPIATAKKKVIGIRPKWLQ